MKSFTIFLLFAISFAAGNNLSNIEKSSQPENQGMFYLGRSPDDCDFSQMTVTSAEHMKYIFEHPQYLACQEKKKASEEEEQKRAEIEKATEKEFSGD